MKKTTSILCALLVFLSVLSLPGYAAAKNEDIPAPYAKRLRDFRIGRTEPIRFALHDIDGNGLNHHRLKGGGLREDG